MIWCGSGVSPRHQSHEKALSRRDAAPTAPVYRDFFIAALGKSLLIVMNRIHRELLQV
jgi:hypothetical protein